MAGVSRFDCYPSDFLNGLVGLPGDAIAAYTVLVMLQYDRGTPVLYVGREHEISVRTGLPRGRLSKAIDHLINVGKIHLVDGAIENNRTSKELEKINERIQKNVENSQEGGEATKRKWEKIRNENSDDAGPIGKPIGKPKQGPISPPSSLPPLDKPTPISLDAARFEKEGREKFDRFWKAMPKPDPADKSEASVEFGKLCDADQDAAAAAAASYAESWRAKPTTHPRSPVKFLRERQFDGFTPTTTAAQDVFITPEMPSWSAWVRHRGSSPPVNGAGGWYFPTEWPPGAEKALGAG